MEAQGFSVVYEPNVAASISAGSECGKDKTEQHEEGQEQGKPLKLLHTTHPFFQKRVTGRLPE